MGVRGLQSFLKNNNFSVAQETQISETTLVIDAANLIHCLFCQSCEDQNSSQWRCDIYGGDLVAFGEAVKEFFTSLNKCGITPILVFDGSTQGKQSTQEQKVSKERTLYERGLKRFKLAQRMMEEYPEESMVSPKSISYIFKNIVHDFGYQRIQAPFDADSLIARIANDLNCYVLSNDSDFLIYSLPKGFVMADSFYHRNMITTKDGRNCIRCLVYSQNRLIKCFPGLKPESLPLLSILLGNDYVEMGTFNRVLGQMLDQTQNTSSLVAETRAHQRIATLLTWLRNKTLEKSIEYVLSLIQLSYRDEVEQAIRTLLRSYCIEKKDNLEAELSEVYPTSRADASATTNRLKLSPPAYLRRLFETNLHSIALDMIVHNTHYNKSPIDCLKFKSSSCVRYRPISLAITLLRPNSSDCNTFDICDRIRDRYCRITLRSMEYLEGFGSVKHLNCYSMIRLKLEKRKSLLMHIFRFTNDELNQMTDSLSQVFTGRFLNEARTCFMLVKYIRLETGCNQKPQFVDALMLTLFYYAARNGQLKKNSIAKTDCRQLLLRLKPHSFSNNGRRYESSPWHYRLIMHFISQLEAAYSGYCLLNTLLDHVFQAPRYERFLNGTLVFRLTKALIFGDLELYRLFDKIPALDEACASIKFMVNRDH